MVVGTVSRHPELAVKLYRMMKVDADGKPRVGDRFGMLGVRPSTNPAVRADIEVDAAGLVHPGEHGMSTFSRPNRTDSKHADWSVESDEVDAGGSLKVVPSPDTADRFHVVPARSMSLVEYQYWLAETRDLWERV